MLAMASSDNTNQAQPKMNSSEKSTSLPQPHASNSHPSLSTSASKAATASKAAASIKNTHPRVQLAHSQPSPSVVLPNGVRVTQISDMQSALRKFLPATPTADAITAFNLTTQLTLNYIKQLSLLKKPATNPGPSKSQPVLLPRPRPVTQTTPAAIPNILTRIIVPSAIQRPLFTPGSRYPTSQKTVQKDPLVCKKYPAQRTTESAKPPVSTERFLKSAQSSREQPQKAHGKVQAFKASSIILPQGLSDKRVPQETLDRLLDLDLSSTILSREQPQLSSETESHCAVSSVSDLPVSKFSLLESRKRKQNIYCLEDSSSIDTSQEKSLQLANLKEKFDTRQKRKRSLLCPSQKRKKYLSGQDVGSLIDIPLQKKRVKPKKPRLKPTSRSFEDPSLLHSSKKQRKTELEKSHLAQAICDMNGDCSPANTNQGDFLPPNTNQGNSNTNQDGYAALLDTNREDCLLLDTDRSKYVRKKPKPKNLRKVPSRKPTSNLSGNHFVQRMASSNAKACVAATMELENVTSERAVMPKEEEIASALHELTKSGKLPAGDYIAVQHPEIEIKPEFNTLGLLYNGSTFHPSAAKVFYTPVNGDLVLPTFIFPLVVPSKTSTVGKAVEKSLDDIQHSQRKHPKGWLALGNAIKTIEYTKNHVMITRQYYIGIQRNEDTVFVRDSVALRAGKNEKPYIGKIASIWKEKDGLMMAVFWYYRPEEVEPASRTGLSFAENELLASQHYDMNSVDCIEGKRYILGREQYCRYRAAVVGGGPYSTPLRKGLVPPVPSRNSASCYVSHFSEDWQEDLGPVYSDLGPSVERLVHTNPSFVYVCQHGYNHLNGRIY